MEKEDVHFILQDQWGRVTRVSPENLEKHHSSHVQENPRQTACENIEAKLGKEAGDLYRELLGLRFVQVIRRKPPMEMKTESKNRRYTKEEFLAAVLSLCKSDREKEIMTEKVNRLWEDRTTQDLTAPEKKK